MLLHLNLLCFTQLLLLLAYSCFTQLLCSSDTKFVRNALAILAGWPKLYNQLSDSQSNWKQNFFQISKFYKTMFFATMNKIIRNKSIDKWERRTNSGRRACDSRAMCLPFFSWVLTSVNPKSVANFIIDKIGKHINQCRNSIMYRRKSQIGTFKY